MAVETPTLNCTAARRAGSPARAASITRSRKSWLYARAMLVLRLNQDERLAPDNRNGNLSPTPKSLNVL
jgi:hypothetical protein